MDTDILREYKRIRQPHVGRYAGTGKVHHYQPKAADALKSARYTVTTQRKWDDLISREVGTVRLRTEPDTIVDIDDLAGDCYDPKANPDIQPHVLAREYMEFVELVNREGLYGLIGEYWNGEEWVNAGSCWGFVGDDYGGYEYDIMNAAIDGFNEQEHCPCCGRPKL